MVNVSLVVFLLVLLFALPALAQDDSNPDPGAVQMPLEMRPPSAQYGEDDYEHIWIPAEAFNQRGTPSWEYHMHGYIYKTGGNRYFVAAVNLPTGADIFRMKLYCYDNSASNNILLWYLRYTTADNSSIGKLGALTSGTPGFTTISFDPYSFDPKMHIFDNYNMHVVVVDLPVDTESLKFKGVRITYKRQVSSAPTTATFSDVPTTHPFFAHIEALAAAGITTGWDDGTFRPDQPVTRQALAAFLARALGLHHTDIVD